MESCQACVSEPEQLMEGNNIRKDKYEKPGLGNWSLNVVWRAGCQR